MSDDQTPADGVKSAGGVDLAESEAVGVEGKGEGHRVCRCLGSLDETLRGIHRLLTRTRVHQAEDQTSLDEGGGVAAALELGAAPLDPPFGMAASHVRAADDAVEGVWQRVAASCKNYLGSVGVADALVDPSGHPSLRCDRIQGREQGVVGCPGGFDDLFGPRDGFNLFD